jgi:hypothetical protein
LTARNSSLVIEELQKLATTESEIGLAYTYCDYRDQKEQTIENILGTLLSQLFRPLANIPESASKLFNKRTTERKPLELADAVNLLRVACEHFNKIYVCIDALDELTNLRKLLEILRDTPSSMRIFMTGRNYIQGTVQEYLKEEVSISIEAHEIDLRLFIEHEIGGENDLEPRAMDEKLRNDILVKVVDSAKGLSV